MKAMRNEVKRALELSVVIAFFIYVWNVVGVSEIPESSFDRYGEGWTFSYNGQEKVIDIPVRQKVDAGDTYEISHVVSWELPSDVRLLYRSLQQEVEIYVDETLIYKYPSEDYIAGLTPNHWNMVELPEDVEGKLLTIRLKSEYEQFSGKIGEIVPRRICSAVLSCTRKVFSCTVGRSGSRSDWMRDLSYQCIYISEKSTSCRNGIRSVVYTYFALDVWGGKGAICEDITTFTALLSVLFASAPSGSILSICLF